MTPAPGRYAFLADALEFMFHGDRAILAAAQAVSGEEYYKERGMGFGSLHNQLVHAMGAQIVWLARLSSGGANSPSRLINQTDYPTREALGAHWPEVHAHWRQYMGQQTLDSLQSRVTWRSIRGESVTEIRGELIFHVTDHGTYHRGQQNTLLKLSGGNPVRLSFYEWRQANPLPG